MYMEPDARHKSPHFHARFGENRATFEIPSGDLIVGSLPRPQRRLIEAWALLRRAELEENWRLMVAGRLPNRIEPPK